MARAGKTDTVHYGSVVRITGAVANNAPGMPVQLERSLGGAAFKKLKKANSRPDGSYRFSLKARRSAAYRAVAADGTPASPSRNVTVVGRVFGHSARNVLGVHAVHVKGTLMPRLRGRAITLQQHTKHGWKTIDRTKTGRKGAYKATFHPKSPGSYKLRVRFAGDANAEAAGKRLRPVHVYHPGGASWYGGGAGACGSTAGLTVANKYLPCGTKVTLHYRGRSVVARVMDRGPFVAGRDWDLTPAVKSALHFGDVGTVWADK
jgi:rare lipoprotein A